MTESGSARLGMMVAETWRRNTKITSTTSTIASSSENLTSSTDSRIDWERSYTVSRLTEGGSRPLGPVNSGNKALMRFTTSTVLVPGCRCTENMMERVLSSQAKLRVSCT